METTYVQPDCPLCPDNHLLEQRIIAQIDKGYLIEASNSPGNYLIVPLDHVETPGALPRDWWAGIMALLSHIPSMHDYNISINIGAVAGQRIGHLHFWVIPRLPGLPSSNKGLARLITEANQ